MTGQNPNMAPDWLCYIVLCFVTGYAPEHLIEKAPLRGD